MKLLAALGSVALLATVATAASISSQTSRSYDVYDDAGLSAGRVTATQRSADAKSWTWSGAGSSGTANYNARLSTAVACVFALESASATGYATMESNGSSGSWMNSTTGDTGTLEAAGVKPAEDVATAGV